MKKTFIYPALALLACACACGKVAEEDFAAGMEPLALRAVVTEGASTRGVATGTALPSSATMYLSADHNGTGATGNYFSNVAFTASSTTWSPASGNYYWPLSGNLEFLAFCNFGPTNFASTATRTNATAISVSSSDWTADDMMFGAATSAPANGKTLTFRHALSQVKFTAKLESASTVNLKGITVNAIKGASLSCTKSAGSASLTVSSSTSGYSAADVTGFSGTQALSTTATSVGTPVLLPDQTISSITVSYASVSGGVEGPVNSVTKSVSRAITKGNAYTFAITITKEGILFDILVNPWGGNAIAIGEFPCTDPHVDYVTFTAGSLGSYTLAMNSVAERDLYYSSDGESWTSWDGSSISVTPETNIYVRYNGGTGMSDFLYRGNSGSWTDDDTIYDGEAECSAGYGAVSVGMLDVEATTSGVKWPVGQMTVMGTSASPVDLSMVSAKDVTVSDSARNTANTYIVNRPGYYMLPLVYGNAITNGVANTISYDTGNTGYGCLDTFHNAYGTGITSPYIETDVTANGHTVSSAALSREDYEGLVNVEGALRTVGGIKYLAFSIEPDDITFGNAVVSAKDEAGTIVWNWNIWVTTDLGHEEEVDVGTYTYSLFPQLLGARPPLTYVNGKHGYALSVKASFEEGQEIVFTGTRVEVNEGGVTRSAYDCCYFQRSRPVAFFYDRIGWTRTNSRAQLKFGITNPNVYYASNWYYPWYSPNSLCLTNGWDAEMNKSAYDSDQDRAVVKTIYDPSPKGYKVCRRNAFEPFLAAHPATSADWKIHSSDSYGYYMYSGTTAPASKDDCLFFAHSSAMDNGGWIDSYSDSYSTCWLSGFKQTDTYYADAVSYYVFFVPSTQYPERSYKGNPTWRYSPPDNNGNIYGAGYALPVRCMSEEHYPSEPLPTFGGLNISSGALKYIGGTYVLDDSWIHSGYGSTYGMSNNSYYHRFNDLGKFFDSRGNTFSTSQTDIDNNGSRVSWGGYDDWRLPTSAELSKLITTSAGVRTGSTVNGSANKHYALIQLTGVSHAGTTTPNGLLLFPDGKTITGKTLSGMDNTTQTTGVTAAQLQTYLDQGCAFFPASGMYGGSFANGGVFGFYLCSSGSNANYRYYLVFGAGWMDVSNDGNRSSEYATVRLVRDAD